MAPPSAAEKREEAWTLSDQVEELRGKYHLKKKALDAYRESSKSDIKKNETTIRKLRQDTQGKHKLVADHENGDERVIKTVFKDDRKELLSLQRLTAEGAIDEMDQMVCQAAQFLNALRYEREKREEKLQEAKVELERMRQLERPCSAQVKKDSEVTRLENSLDKGQIKYEAASSITRCYRDIQTKLREESLMLPAKLDTMEAALLQQMRELAELKAMSKATHAARDEAKQQLAKTEAQAYEAKRLRDAELSTTRKEVERRKTDSEKTERRAARAALLVDTSDQKALEVAREQDKKKTILIYEEAFRRIMEAANATSIEEALERFSKHRETYNQLKVRLTEQENQRNRLRDTVAKLTLQHHDMKYTGEQKMSKGQRRLEELEKRLEDTRKPLDQRTDQARRCGDTLISIKAGVMTLVDKLSPIKLRPPEHSFTKGDVFEKLEMCRKKLEHLITDLGESIQASPSLIKAIMDPEFQDFMESNIPADNTRILIETSDSTHAFNHMDSEETQEVLSRTEIKRLGQKLIDSKIKPKKKKAKKAK